MWWIIPSAPQPTSRSLSSIFSRIIVSFPCLVDAKVLRNLTGLLGARTDPGLTSTLSGFLRVVLMMAISISGIPYR
uniref:Uncharacterized protein MANES_10G135100 n=1 Tax=Rhizophora mucronata TaxID=61149 RepID=A0A2P2MNS3_RHIMU